MTEAEILIDRRCFASLNASDLIWQLLQAGSQSREGESVGEYNISRLETDEMNNVTGLSLGWRELGEAPKSSAKETASKKKERRNSSEKKKWWLIANLDSSFVQRNLKIRIYFFRSESKEI